LRCKERRKEGGEGTKKEKRKRDGQKGAEEPKKKTGADNEVTGGFCLPRNMTPGLGEKKPSLDPKKDKTKRKN